MKYTSLISPYLKLIRLDKPIGTLLLLWPTLWAIFIAEHGAIQLKYIIVFSIGTFLARSAGCVFNDVCDVKFDSKVERTRNRPLVRGAISKRSAIVFGCALSVIAFILASSTLSTATIMLSFPAFILYTTYPLFKRFFPVPQAYLGIAFSFGIFMVFMQISSLINYIAISLFIANIFWVIGYDTIYALADMQDDKKINIKTSAITFGKYVTHVISICYLMFIIIMCAIGINLHFTFWYYFCLVLSGVLLYKQIMVVQKQMVNKYLDMFRLNNYIGMIIFIGIFFNYL